MEKVNLVLSFEDYEIVEKALVSKLHYLDENSEEYKKLWSITGYVFSASYNERHNEQPPPVQPSTPARVPQQNNPPPPPPSIPPTASSRTEFGTSRS